MSTPSPSESAALASAFRLAERGRLSTSPNPMVGALVVSGARILGSGWHRRAGEPHAEVLALRAAGEAARGATLVVTLEPCSVVGRTPACTEAILASGVRRVLVGARDVNPRVAGAGIGRLLGAGLEVVADLDSARDRRLNERFRTWISTGRPFVEIKLATTLDGKIALADGESKWISGRPARARVQWLREEYDAIAVGVGTVLRDDPRLSRRLGFRRALGLRPLLRVIFDRRLETPPGARLFAAGAPVLVVGETEDGDRAAGLRAAGAEIFPARGSDREVYGAVLAELGRRDVTGLLVEGGGRLAARMLRAGCVDRWTSVVAPRLFGDVAAPGALAEAVTASVDEAPTLDECEVTRIGVDAWISGRLRCRATAPEQRS